MMIAWTKSKIKESITNILDLGGSVSFSYKGSLDSWYQTINLHYFPGYYSPPTYNINSGPCHGDYKSKDEAIDKFIDCIFSENNLAYCLERIKVRLNIDFEEAGFDFEHPSQELLDIIEEEKLIIKNELK